MLNTHFIFSPLTTASPHHRISAALGLMYLLSLANRSPSIAGTVPEIDPSALNAQASWGGAIQLKVQLAEPESITSETTWIASHDQALANPGPLGEPEPIIVGTASIALYELGPGNPGPLGEPEPIIVGTALIAFYEKGLGDAAPLGEPEPIIVGKVLMAFYTQEGDRGALGEFEGVALFPPASEVSGAVAFGGKQYGIRFLWRWGAFWVGRDSLIVVVFG